MNIQSHIVLVTLCVLGAGCSITTGPVNDGFELSQESIDHGRFFGEELLGLTVETSELKKHYQQP